VIYTHFEKAFNEVPHSDRGFNKQISYRIVLIVNWVRMVLMRHLLNGH